MSIRFFNSITGETPPVMPRLNESVSETKWTSLNLTNGWADVGSFSNIIGTWNYGSPPGYRFLPDGRLELRGLVKKNTQALPYELIAMIPSIFPVSSGGNSQGSLVSSTCYNEAALRAESSYYLIHGQSLLYGYGLNNFWFSLTGSVSPSPRPFMFLGDKSAAASNSLGTTTATYPDLIGNQLGVNRISNINSNYSFQDVSGIPNLYSTFPDMVRNYPRALVIDASLNDLRGTNSLFTAERYQLKLADYVKRFVEYTAMPPDRIILCGPGIISQFQAGGNFNSGNAIRLQQWREATRNVAQQYRTRFADFYKAMQQSGLSTSQLTSGDFYTRDAHVIMKDTILNASV